MWVPASLGDLLVLEYGKPLKSEDRDSSGSIPVAGSNGADGTHSTALVSGPGIVVGRKGSAGKVVWYDSDFWPIDTTYYVVAKDPLELRWVYYLLVQANLSRLAITTGVPGLNRNDVYAVRTNLPPVSEQRRIIELLDHADTLRRLRAEGSRKAESISSAIFMKLFGDVAANSMQWPMKCIGDVTTLVTSGSTPRGGAEVYVQDGPYLIRSQNVLMNRLELSGVARITKETHEQMSRTHVKIGDVLLNITGASIGRVTSVSRLETEANVNQHVCILRPDRSQVLPEYLSMFLSLPQQQAVIRSVQAGASRQALNHAQVRALKVALPPLALQQDFALAAEVVGRILEETDRASQVLERLFNSMMYRAFSGELTANWRKAHLTNLLTELEQQARLLNLRSPEAAQLLAGG